MSLETFIPEIRHIAVGGKHVRVAPLKVRQIPAFTRHIALAAGALMSGDLMAAIALHGEALIEAMAVATGESREWLGDLEADEFLHLVGGVLEVNTDFFVHRVSPALSQTLAMLMARMPGPTPSPSSPAPASPSETPSI